MVSDLLRASQAHALALTFFVFVHSPLTHNTLLIVELDNVTDKAGCDYRTVARSNSSRIDLPHEHICHEQPAILANLDL
jgi:hypothetical protein